MVPANKKGSCAMASRIPAISGRSSLASIAAARASEPLGPVEPMSRGALNWHITIPADGKFHYTGKVGGEISLEEAAAIGVKAGEGASSEDEIMIVCIAEGEKPDMVELTEFMAERMPYFMVPRYIRFVDSLPKTPTERVQKNKLREQLAQHRLPTDPGSRH